MSSLPIYIVKKNVHIVIYKWQNCSVYLKKLLQYNFNKTFSKSEYKTNAISGYERIENLNGGCGLLKTSWLLAIKLYVFSIILI